MTASESGGPLPLSRPSEDATVQQPRRPVVERRRDTWTDDQPRPGWVAVQCRDWPDGAREVAVDVAASGLLFADPSKLCDVASSLLRAAVWLEGNDR